MYQIGAVKENTRESKTNVVNTKQRQAENKMF